MYYTTTYYTVESERADYAKRIREFERQWAYERSIVCSVLVSVIGAVSVDIPTTDREEPG